MRRIIFVVLLISLGIGGWWLWKEGSTFRDTLVKYVENGELVTLEARYTPESIMDGHRASLVPDSQHAYQAPELKFFPYLLVEAKYVQSDRKTREGFLLWGLVDGEMVIDTDTWERTHGFADAIEAHATRTDFKILNTLAKYQGSCSKEQLQRDLHVDAETLDPWIETVLQKHLVVRSNGELHLHLQNPIILVSPHTKLRQSFVTKAYNHAQCVNKRFSRGQIEKIAQAAFGPSFTIRNVNEVYLPVYCINVQNPDGSIMPSYWNAISGERIVVRL